MGKINRLKCDHCGKEYEKYIEYPVGWCRNQIIIDKEEYNVDIHIEPSVTCGSAQGDTIRDEGVDFCPVCNDRMMELIVKPEILNRKLRK